VINYALDRLISMLRHMAAVGPSSAVFRIPDWRALDAAERRQRQIDARDRARALNPVLNAFVASERGDDSKKSHLAPGGLPYAAKDMFRTSTHRPCCGLAQIPALDIAGETALLDRFDAAGADLIGFTSMTELAYEPSGFNAACGRVRNPWNLDYISGGSSSGSAAAVAAGVVVAALGSDTGGSLRIPAHACGVTAWKPTYGVVSVQGAMALAPTLDSIGLLARSAEDIMELAPLMADLSPPRGTSRAVVLEDVVAECEPAIRRRAARAIEALAAAGVTVGHRPALAAVEAIDRHAMIVMQGESARVHRTSLADATLAPVLRRRLAKGMAITDAELTESVHTRARLARDFAEQILAASDLAVLPVMAIPTPTANECDPGSERFAPRTLYALSRFTRFVNMLGFPAVALPAGFDDRGMPVAVQLVGRRGADLDLLDLARQVQSMTDWHGRVPAAVADVMPHVAPAS
jgi:aspartyl-tRNA(Asn)/glutamyl-tRNA(Gln) amidotransferase subunit A